MHTRSIENWRHSHDFSAIYQHGERRTLQVLVLTAVTMVIEIGAGSLSGSMALLADGWHMGTHAAAFGITIFAYRYARRHSEDPNFSFGTGKVSVLGGFASAIALAIIAFVMAFESIQRLVSPRVIHFNEAIAVAAFGLAINIISALLLQQPRSRPAEGYAHGHLHDHNLKAAYLHVAADALMSLLAVAALSFGKFLGWHWLDSAMGIVGAVVITRWAYGLARETSAILLDTNLGAADMSDLIRVIEADSDNRMSDLHLWKLGPKDFAAIVSIVTRFPKPPEYYKKLLTDFDGISHITVEVNPIDSPSAITLETMSSDERETAARSQKD